MDDQWVSLFSGGKDSSWALYAALESGRNVSQLVTVHPPADSYLYHVPATRLAELAAESIDLPLLEVEAAFETEDITDSTQQGDRELEPLEVALRKVDRESGLTGITAGAVASEYQARRLRGMCERLGLDLYTPLWQREPIECLEAMYAAGFEILIVAVAAGGFDESWIGRQLDADAIADLMELRDTYGIHPMGEGGEFETLVTDGPHMDQRIDVDYRIEWDGSRGEAVITDAWLS